MSQTIRRARFPTELYRVCHAAVPVPHRAVVCKLVLSRSNSEDPADIERKLVLCTFAQLCVHFKLCTSTAVCVYTTRKPHLHKYEGLQLYSLSSIKATHIVALDKMHHLRPFAAPDQNNKLIEISRNYLVIFSENRNAPDFECP